MSVDGPLLGRGFRVKRARSAHKRAYKQSSDRQQLFKKQNIESSSNTSSFDCELPAPASMLRPASTPIVDSEKAACPKATPKVRPRPKTARTNR